MGLKGAVRVNHPLITCSSARSRNKTVTGQKLIKLQNHSTKDTKQVIACSSIARNLEHLIQEQSCEWKIRPFLSLKKTRKQKLRNKTQYTSLRFPETVAGQSFVKSCFHEWAMVWMLQVEAQLKGRSQFVTRPESLKRSAKSLLRGTLVQVNADQAGPFRF